MIPGAGRSPVEGNGYPPTPVFLLGEFHGLRSLAGYNPSDHKQPDTTNTFIFF